MLLCLLASARPTEPMDVRFGAEADYGPFIYVEADGQPRGLSVDMLSLIAQRANLRVQTLPPRPLKDLLESVQRREIDLLSSLRPTPERSAFLLFSRPYVSVPAVLVLRRQDPLRHSSAAELWQALRGKSVAVGSGYAVETFVRNSRPDVRWQGVPDDVQALRGLQQGVHDAAVLDLASLAFIARQHGLAELDAVRPVGFDYSLSFAVPHERADLLERIETGLAAIPAAERTAVVARWMAPLELDEQAPSAGPVRLLVLLLLALGAGLGLWGWLRSRRRQQGP
jgi:ABC-type amino acid transport substrate-binding protein